MYKLISGAKSVKQYRGDENLPEAKKGMKNCGCKHPKSKYKYGAGALTIPEGSAIVTANGGKNMQALEAYEEGDFPRLNKIINKMPEDSNRAKNGIKNTYKKYKFKPGAKNVNAEDEDDFSWIKKILNYESTAGSAAGTGLSNYGIQKEKYASKYPKMWKDNKIDEKEAIEFIKKEYLPMVKNYPVEVQKRLVDYAYNTGRNVEDVLLLASGDKNLNDVQTQNTDLNLFNQKKDEIIKNMSNPEFIKKIDSAKHEILKDTWTRKGNPEAYEKSSKGRIDMWNEGSPKSNAVPAGSNATLTRNPITGEMAPVTTNPAAPKETWTGTGKTYAYKAKTQGRLDYQPDRFNDETWSEQNYPAWMQTVAGGLKDKERAGKIVNYLKNYKGQDYEDVQRIVNTPGLNNEQLLQKIEKLSTDQKVGPFHVAVQEALKETEGEKPKDEPGKTNTVEEGDKKTEIIPPPQPPGSIPPQRKNFIVPSLAEVSARGSVLSQGVENVPENYLKLGRYKYASQLPKTLQEIQLAEQAGRESARDVVAGDAGRYLAQAGNLSSARMKAANDAVIQDTLARQDILNRNVDLGNTEAQTNTELKNAYGMQRAANRGAYNDQLVAFGQSIDTASDASKLMSAQKDADDIKMNLLKSKNYYMDPQGNIRMGKKGIKKVKTYKRK